MDILIVGGGGREHAMAWRIAQSELAGRVYVAPGNAGTARERGVENVPIAAEDIAGLKDFALARGIGLTLIGPEAPLVAGIVDDFSAAGLRCFGPSREAAALEGSKSFTKEFLTRHGIPTAAFGTFTDMESAKRHIRKQGAPIVIKADGLAAGKGVVVARHVDEALQAAEAMLSGNRFGAAGWRIVLLASLGGTLEFYDFVIFGIFARDIADAIFPSSSLLVSLMASFAAFAAGYLVRPLGGIVLSHYGDRYGRRRVFLWPVFVMSGATLGMGLVPTHAQWGGAASALMVGSYQGSPSETRCTQASGGCPFRPSSLGGTARANTRMEPTRPAILRRAAHSQHWTARHR